MTGLKFKRTLPRAAALAAVLAAIICLNAAARAETLEQARWNFEDFYKYDKDLPFNLEEKVFKETDKYTLYRWEFDSTHGKRVTALFSVPKGVKGPFPVVLFLHGYTGNKGDVVTALDAMSPLGYAALALDAEYHGERAVPGKNMYSKLLYSTRDAMMQTIVDYRRAMDILETRPEIDKNRIGYIGGSMGGIFGAVLAAVDTRIRATVLAVGGADWGFLINASVVSQALGLASGEHPLKPKLFREVVAPVDPINWAQKISPRPVLMLNATHDVLVNPKANIFLFNRLLPPKKIVWFNSGHELPWAPALDQAAKFFADYLTGDKDPASLGSVIEGYDTQPLSMELEKPLPQPITDMPLARLFDY